MFNLEDYYNKCSDGNIVDNAEIYDYIQSFKNVILWGASYQGSAVGKKLLEKGITITTYWDLRAEELNTVHGTTVIPPFSKEFNRDNTVVIFCIPNHVIMGSLLAQLKENNYFNVIRGDILYSGICCTINNKTGLLAKSCWKTKECRSIICTRAKNILVNSCKEKKPGDRIDLQYSVFILTSKCNLSCIHCVQYMNDYPAVKKINVPFHEIKKDIHTFFDTIDSVGTVSVMGGETFMHPDISKIIIEFSKHKNFGFLTLPTNGLYPIKPEQLTGISDNRIIIAFGYYLHIASEKQREIYRKNIELVKSFGITYTESKYLPSWVVPSGLDKLDVDKAYMTMKKQNCKMPPRNLQVRYGKVHICDMSVAIHAIGMADYPDDYLNLRDECNLKERRSRLRSLIDRSFYYTCGHCRNANSEPEYISSALQKKRGADK
jgi:hypothetical protein